MSDPVIRSVGTDRGTGPRGKQSFADEGTGTGVSGMLALFEAKIDGKLAVQDAKIAAVEDRVMRHVSEEAIRIERDLSAQISELSETMRSFKPGATWQQVGGVVFAGITLLVGILAFVGSSFNSGITSMGAVEEAIDAQRELNASQNERIDRILTILEAMNAKPNAVPEAPKAP